MTQKNYPWVNELDKLIGIHEATPAGAAAVDQMWRDVQLGGYVGKATKVPWCSAAVGASLYRAGLPNKSNNGLVKENSQYWLGYGTKLDKPAYGCIVVFKWGWGGGHVGYVVGRSPGGSLLVLGGNQDDSVCVKAFKTNSIVGYRWPETSEVPDYNLPIASAQEIHTTR